MKGSLTTLLATLAITVMLPISESEALKLVTYTFDDESRIGAVVGEDVVDLNRAYRALLRSQEDPRPRAMADAIVPSDMVAFLSGEERSMNAAEEAVAFAGEQPAEEMRTTGVLKSLEDVSLNAPVPRPPKIVLMGFNYRAHADEMLEDVPEHPMLFAAYANAVNRPGGEVVIPPKSTKPDHELEFGVVIGKRGKNIPPEEAMDYVAGYTIVNDGTDREWQTRTKQYLIGKSVRTFKVMGPYLVTKDEISDPHDLDMRLWVNGALRQESNTGLQVYKFPDVVSYMSDIWELEPGDVLSTGTPQGVGHRREPPVYLKPGDQVRLQISGLGELEYSVTAEE